VTISITLTHYDLGPLKVQIWEEATWRMRRRIWTCPDDPELGSFENGDFEEAPVTIETLLLAARNDQIASATTLPHKGEGPPPLWGELSFQRGRLEDAADPSGSEFLLAAAG
jgi:hypothetical protein